MADMEVTDGAHTEILGMCQEVHLHHGVSFHGAALLLGPQQLYMVSFHNIHNGQDPIPTLLVHTWDHLEQLLPPTILTTGTTTNLGPVFRYQSFRQLQSLHSIHMLQHPLEAVQLVRSQYH